MARKAKRDLTIEEQLARGPVDLPFLMLVVLLTVIGLIMLLSASYAAAYYDLENESHHDPFYYAPTASHLRRTGFCGHVCGLQNRLPALPLAVGFCR